MSAQRQSRIMAARLRRQRQIEKRELLPRGLVVWGYDDFRPYNYAVTKQSFEGTGWIPINKAMPKWKHINVSSIYVKECGKHGDCMFHVIAAGLKQLQHHSALSMVELRQLASDQLTEAVLPDFLLSWDPPKKLESMDNKSKLAQVKLLIKTPGNGYWGETGTAQHLLLHSKHFKDRALGFAILSIRDRPVKNKDKVIIGHEPRVYTQILRLESTKHLMCLYDVGNVHWVLLGVAHGNSIGSTFRIDQYPAALYPFLREPEEK